MEQEQEALVLQTRVTLRLPKKKTALVPMRRSVTLVSQSGRHSFPGLILDFMRSVLLAFMKTIYFCLRSGVTDQVL